MHDTQRPRTRHRAERPARRDRVRAARRGRTTSRTRPAETAGRRDSPDDGQRSPDVLEADAPPHHHREEDDGRDDVHGRRGERDAPDEPVEDGVERGVERHGTERDPGRHPVRLHGEAAVEDEHPAVEDEADRERLQALGDDHGVLGGELTALVDEADDRLREDRGEVRREPAGTRSAAGRRRAHAEGPPCRCARRAARASGTEHTATAKIPCGSMYSRNALSMAAGASSGSSSLDAKSVSTRKFTLTRPIVSVTGSMSTSTRLTAGRASRRPG